MKISVIGSGYVGVVTAAGLAEKGNDVVIMDVDEEKIDSLSKGKVQFYEPGLEELVNNTIKKGHLTATKSVAEAVRNSEVIFIAVGTPQGETHIVYDGYVISATQDIGSAIRETRDFKIIAVKSTVLPGTTRRLKDILLSHRPEGTFAVASNPEFLKEGNALEDFRHPDRIIVGADDERVKTILSELYEPFMRIRDKLIFMGIEDAELTKYAANGMLALRIAYMNELALLAERVGANIDDIRRGIGLDPRIGQKFLFPGPGYGGSCFPKDVRGLAEFARDKESPLSILEAVHDANVRQRYWPADTIKKYYNGNIREREIAVWGAAFKPRTSDVRESPGIYTIKRLLEYGAKVRVYDPEPRAIENLRREFNSRIQYFDHVYNVLDNAQGLLIITDWDEFKGIDLEEVRVRLKEPVIVDARNLYKGEKLLDIKKHGFDYISLGRPRISR